MMFRGSLFAKIFVSFWIALTVTGALGVLLTMTTDPRAAEHKRHQQRLEEEGRALVAAYTQGGAAGLDARRAALRQAPEPPVFLLRGGELLGSEPLPAAMAALAQQALRSGRIQFENTEQGFWAAVPSGADYVYLRTLTRPSPLERIFDPYSLGPRLAVTFLVTGLVCFLLARSLTAPLTRLRHATHAFAAGNLAVRVGAGMASRDEIGALGHDFDAMAERIEQLVASQRTLLRDISHELRSPLTRLAIALELARQPAGAAAATHLDRIEREAGRLNELIGQLTTLTLLESGAALVQRECFDLRQLVAEVVADADFEARSRQRRVEFRSVGSTLFIDGSPELLRQAVENVVRNAVRYTPETAAVEVELTQRDGEAQLLVRDFGPGVAEGALVRIFLPFYRTDDARDRQCGGSGIGLAIVERAVHVHGGRVTAYNAVDGGLRVELLFPIAGL